MTTGATSTSLKSRGTVSGVGCLRTKRLGLWLELSSVAICKQARVLSAPPAWLRSTLI